MEEYLACAPNLSDEAQVKEVVTHLTRSAKSWWKTHQTDEHVENLVKSIKTWVKLKKVSHDQFRIGNLDWIL